MYYIGWAMMPNYRELAKEVQEACGKVNRERDIETITKDPRYGRTVFEGKLKEGSTVSEFELLSWVDCGNLCFGGECEINGLNFKGSYNTD